MPVSNLGTAGTPSFPTRAASVTKSDVTKFTPSVIWVGGAGDVNVVTAGGDTVLFPGMIAGAVIPVECVQVLSGSTTATNMIRIW
jgi:hypothetical protein